MGCRQVAAMHLVPLIARLVLAAAFIPAGWGKVMVTSTVEGAQAAEIRTLLASPWSDSSATDADATTDADERDETTAAPDSTEDPATESMEAPLEIRNVLRLALTLDAAGAPRPVVLAWIAALLELVGGGLLVIGLLSRVWALGLLIVMGVAFALTSLEPITTLGPFGLDRPEYLKAVAQISLSALALGVVLTGPGAVAIDHAVQLLGGLASSATATPLQRLNRLMSGASTSDDMRDRGAEAYRSALDLAARRGNTIDTFWDTYASSCVASAVRTGDRGWFAVYEPNGLQLTTASGYDCLAWLTSIRTEADIVRAAVVEATETARRQGVYPGVMRDLRRQHRMEWVGWERQDRPP